MSPACVLTTDRLATAKTTLNSDVTSAPANSCNTGRLPADASRALLRLRIPLVLSAILVLGGVLAGPSASSKHFELLSSWAHHVIGVSADDGPSGTAACPVLVLPNSQAPPILQSPTIRPIASRQWDESSSADEAPLEVGGRVWHAVPHAMGPHATPTSGSPTLFLLGILLRL